MWQPVSDELLGGIIAVLNGISLVFIIIFGVLTLIIYPEGAIFVGLWGLVAYTMMVAGLNLRHCAQQCPNYDRDSVGK